MVFKYSKMLAEEIREMKIRLENEIKNEIKAVRTEIEQIDKEIECVLREAKKVETEWAELWLATRLKTLKMKKKILLQRKSALEEVIHALYEPSELEDILKKSEVILEEIKDFLTEIENREKDAVILPITNIDKNTYFKMLEEDLEEELEVIRAIRKGDMEVDEVKKELDLE
jgi:hypothetical protein